jgi:hypothetical protein
VIGKLVYFSFIFTNDQMPFSFVGTLISNLQKHSVDLSHDTLKQVIHKAQQASIRTLKSEKAVSPHIDHDLLV